MPQEHQEHQETPQRRIMVGSNGTFHACMPVLDGKNFEQWCIKMGVIFSFQEVLEMVKNGIQEVEVGATEVQREVCRESKKKDCKALFLIHQYVVDSANFENIVSTNSAKEAWDILNKSYGSADKIKKRNDGGGSKNKKGKWKNKLKDSSEGSKVSNQNSSGNNYKKNGGCGKFRKRGDECYSNKEKQKKEDEAQMAQGDSDDFDSNHVLLMVTSDCAKSNFWYSDTGCSNHMTGNKGWFVNLDEKAKRMVKFVDNSTVTIEGMGKVLIHRRDGQQSFIIDKPESTEKERDGPWFALYRATKGVMLRKQFRFSHVDLRELDNHLRVTKEGYMMHLALLVKTKPVPFEQAIREPEWKAATEEELKVNTKKPPYNQKPELAQFFTVPIASLKSQASFIILDRLRGLKAQTQHLNYSQRPLTK
ncbi:hypothetical protein CR513_04403, partial [Mucuna pruriens]